MPLTPSPVAGPRRRSMLAGTLSTLGPLAALGALGSTAGCSDDDDRTDAAQALEQQRLRKTATRHSRALLVRYDATAAAHSVLADRLSPLRAATARHAEAFGGKGAARLHDGTSGSDGDDGTSGSNADGKDADGRTDGGKAAVPGDRKAALTALAGAERRTADVRTAALAKAPPELARLLASVAAAGAAHAYLLGAHAADGKDDDT